MSFKTEYEARIARVNQENEAAMASKVWWLFISRHADEIVNCDANFQMAQSMLSEASHLFTLENLETFFSEDPAFRSSLGLTSKDAEREKLVSELSGLFTGSPLAINGEIAKLKYLDNSALREKIIAVRTKREMQSKTPDQLRAIVESGRPEPVKLELPVEMTRSYLLKLSPSDLRRILNKFGSDVVNRRIANLG